MKQHLYDVAPRRSRRALDGTSGDVASCLAKSPPIAPGARSSGGLRECNDFGSWSEEDADAWWRANGHVPRRVAAGGQRRLPPGSIRDPDRCRHVADLPAS
jgi:hypothetical protein